MTSFRLALSALVATLVACSGPDVTTLTISALPAKVEVGTGNFVTIEVRGRVGEVALYEQSEITLSTDYASFSDGGNEQVVTLNISGQKATAKLFSPARPGTAEVTARYVDPYGVEVKATTTVEFTVPPVATLNFSCTAKNIGAFLDGQDMAVRCDATPFDAGGVAVRNARVFFLTEAGKFSPPEEEEGPGARRLFTYNPKEDGRIPRDVPPEGDDINGEPRWTDPVGPIVRNPRDGLCTLVAIVETPTDGFQGEPYVDANDNDKYDDGEDFFDANDNGVWDDFQDTHLWKMIKILWTGEDWGHPASYVKSTAGDSSFDVERGGTLALNFRFLDRNFNVLAQNGVDGAIEWSSDADLEIIGGGSNEFGNVDPWGMDIDNNTYRLRNPDRATSYMRGSSYTVTIRNVNEDMTDSEPPQPKPQNYELKADVTHYTSTDADGAPSNELTESMDVFAAGQLK